MKRNAYFAISALPGCSGITTNGPPRDRQGSRDESLRPLRPASRRHLASFEPEEPPLRVKATGVPAERAVRREDAVARDDDRDRVRTERLTRGARGSLAACLCGDPGIRRDLAERDACRRRQDPPLELRERREVDRDVEPPARAAEVLIELTRDGIDAARIGQQARPVRAHDARELGSGRLAAVMDREHALRTDCDPERPEGRIDDAIANR